LFEGRPSAISLRELVKRRTITRGREEIDMTCGICRQPTAIAILLSKAQGLSILAQFRAHAARVLEVEPQELDSVQNMRIMKNAPALICPRCYVQLFKKADWLPDDVYREKWTLEGRVPDHAPHLCFQAKMMDMSPVVSRPAK
jgi:hypothetical protein